MSRWPVAGPSEYQLLASSPATKVCKTAIHTHSKNNTHEVTKSTHKIVTQYTECALEKQHKGDKVLYLVSDIVTPVNNCQSVHLDVETPLRFITRCPLSLFRVEHRYMGWWSYNALLLGGFVLDGNKWLDLSFGCFTPVE